MLKPTPRPPEYYAFPCLMIDSGEHAGLFEGLPNRIPTLCRAVQGVLLYIFWAERDGVTLSQGRKQYEHQKKAR